MEVKDRIILGGKELFFRYGVKSITMDDIARHLAISKKTIYQYFQDKNELVCAVTEQHMTSQENDLEEIRKNAKDPVDELLKISDYMKVALQNINMMVLFEIQKYHPVAYAIFEKHKFECVYRCLEENLIKGQKAGLYRPELNIEIVAKLRLEGIMFAFNHVLFPPDRFTLQQVQVEVLTHYIYGICTLKGHKLINKYKQIQEED